MAFASIPANIASATHALYNTEPINTLLVTLKKVIFLNRLYIAMNNEEQDVKKKIMMVVGACIFLVAAAQALPLFFGL